MLFGCALDREATPLKEPQNDKGSPVRGGGREQRVVLHGHRGDLVWASTIDPQAVEPEEPRSAPGFDRKAMRLVHREPEEREIRVEVDFTGAGNWGTYGVFRVPAGEPVEHRFPDAFGHWVRLVSDRDGDITGQFRYE